MVNKVNIKIHPLSLVAVDPLTKLVVMSSEKFEDQTHKGFHCDSNIFLQGVAIYARKMTANPTEDVALMIANEVTDYWVKVWGFEFEHQGSFFVIKMPKEKFEAWENEHLESVMSATIKE